MKELKIAFVHSKCKPFRVPVFEKIKELYDVDFFFTDKTAQIDSYFIKSKKLPFCSDFHYTFGLEQKLKEKEYDIFISTDLGYHITYITHKVAKEKNKKFILWNEQWKDILHPRRMFVTYLKENKIIKNSDAILAFGNKAVEFVNKRGANPKNVVWTPNIVPKDRTGENLIKSKDGKINILCLGRLIPVKGQDILIKAFVEVLQKFPNSRLLIAGEGPEYNKLVNLTKKYKIQDKVTITGKKVDSKEKWELYNQCDIFVLPSVFRKTPEAWGLVVNEAAQMGKAIITTDMTGVAGEVVQHNYSGLVVKQKDIKDLSASLIRLIDNVDLRKQFGEKAKELVQDRYNLEEVERSFIKAINLVK